MSPARISRRGVLAGAGAALASAALPVGVVEAVAAETAPAAAAMALPFDPTAFIDELLATGHRIAIHEPCLRRGSDDDLRPYFWVYPERDGGFNRAYVEVMARWAERLDATPDHVERVVAHLRERVGRERAEKKCGEFIDQRTVVAETSGRTV